jgi:hypothetical protein
LKAGVDASLRPWRIGCHGLPVYADLAARIADITALLGSAFVRRRTAKNLAHDNRVSITIDHDTPDVMSITGLSIAARAHCVSDQAEAEKVIAMLPLKYPDAPPATAQMKMPGIQIPTSLRPFASLARRAAPHQHPLRAIVIQSDRSS